MKDKRSPLERLAPHGMGFPADCCAWCGRQRPIGRLTHVSGGAHPTIPGEVRSVGFCSDPCAHKDAAVWGTLETPQSQPLEPPTAQKNPNS